MQKSILSLMLSLKQCTLFRTIRSILIILHDRSVLCKIYLMSMYRSIACLPQLDVKEYKSEVGNLLRLDGRIKYYL